MGSFDWMGDIGTALATPLAARYQRTALENAQATQKSQYQKNQGYFDPYYQQGTAALGNLSNNINSGAYNVNVTPQNLQNDPGYQFQLQQGQKALERSAAAHGSLMSGGFMKGLDAYSQGLASTQYQNAWDRQYRQNQFNYNAQAGLANMGMGAAGSLANLGQNYGNTMAGYDLDLGNINAGELMGQVQAGGRAASGFTNMGTQMAMSAGSGGMLGGAGGLGGMGGGMGGMAAPGGGYTGMDYGGVGYDAGTGIPWGSSGMAPVGGGQGIPSQYNYADNYGLIPPQYGGGY